MLKSNLPPLLLILFLASLILHKLTPNDSFFLNLATEVLGIILTVFLIDRILKDQNKEKWKNVDKRIGTQLKLLINMSISGIRSSLKLDPNLIEHYSNNSTQPNEIHKAIVQIGTKEIKPNLLSLLSSLDSDQWFNLTLHLQTSNNSLNDFLNSFQTLVSPEQMEYLLDLQEALRHACTAYGVFPDVMGIDLPPSQDESSIDALTLQKSMCRSTAQDLEKVIILLEKLSISIKT